MNIERDTYNFFSIALNPLIQLKGTHQWTANDNRAIQLLTIIISEIL